MSKTREEIQNIAINLSEEYNKLLLEWATGIGKSYASIKIIEKLGGKWNIVVAETNHISNWEEEFKKHNKSRLLKNINFFCYQSLHKYLNGKKYIFDEAHHLLSDKRLKLLNKIKADNIIMLSATVTKNQKILLTSNIGEFHTNKVTLSDAIEFGILPEPNVYFVGVELNTIQKNCKFHFNKDKYIYCSEREMYNRMSDRIDYLKEKYFNSRSEFDKVKWLNYANKRKQFLSECKTKYAKILLNKLKEKRLICFTGSIKQSEELSKGLSIHSKLSTKKRVQLLEDFNSGTIDKLFATGMLKEGQNLANIEAGLIIQLDNVERYFVQTHGRTLRSQYPEQYVLYVKNTQDQVYVNTAIENFNKDYIKFIEL